MCQILQLCIGFRLKSSQGWYACDMKGAGGGGGVHGFVGEQGGGDFYVPVKSNATLPQGTPWAFECVKFQFKFPTPGVKTVFYASHH